MSFLKKLFFNKSEKKIDLKNLDNVLKLDLGVFHENDIETNYETIQKETFNRDFDIDKVDLFENPIKNLIILFNMHNQIMNGGIIQFIDNHSGMYFFEAKDALSEINAIEIVDILNEVLTIFPNKHIPKDWSERRNAIDDINDKLSQEESWELESFYDKLDRRYYKYENRFMNNIVDYVKTELEKPNAQQRV